MMARRGLLSRRALHSMLGDQATPGRLNCVIVKQPQLSEKGLSVNLACDRFLE